MQASKSNSKFSLMGDEAAYKAMPKYYDKSTLTQPDFTNQKLIGYDIYLNGGYIVFDDNHKIYWDDKTQSYKDLSKLPKQEQDAILSKLGTQSGIVERQSQKDLQAWLDSLPVDIDLMKMIEVDPSKIKDNSFMGLYAGYHETSKDFILESIYARKNTTIYKKFQQRAYWAKIGTLIRKPPFNLQFPVISNLQIQGKGIPSIPGIIQSGIDEVLPGLVPAPVSNMPQQPPLPLHLNMLESKKDMDNFIFGKTRNNTQTINEFLSRGGQLPNTLIARIYEIQQNKLGTTKMSGVRSQKLMLIIDKLRQSWTINGEEKDFSDILRASQPINQLQQGNDETKFTLPTNDSISAAINILRNSRGYSHGFQPEEKINMVMSNNEIIKVISKLSTEEKADIIRAFNTYGIEIPPMQRSDQNSRLFSQMDMLSLSEQVDLIQKINNIVSNSSQISDVYKAKFKTPAISPGQGQEMHFNPQIMIDGLRQIFINIAQNTGFFDIATAGYMFDANAHNFQMVYSTRLSELGDMSPENEALAFEEVIKYFFSWLINDKTIKQGGRGWRFKPEFFRSVWNEFRQEFVKMGSQWNLEKVYEDLQNGSLESNIYQLYNQLMEPPVNVLTTAGGSSSSSDNPYAQDLNLDELKDIEVAAQDIFQSAIQANEVMLRVRSLQISSDRTSADREIILTDLNTGKERRIKLKNLAYLLSLLGFVGATIIGIIKTITLLKYGDPPIDLPPIPPIKPPINPQLPNQPTNPDQPNTQPTQPIVTPDAPANQLNEEGGINDGFEYPLFIDPAESELFLLKKSLENEENRLWNHFSLVQKNPELGNADNRAKDYNPLIRNNVQNYMNRFSNNFEIKDSGFNKPTPKLYDQIQAPPKTRMIPNYQNHYGKIHFEDENTNIQMSNTKFQPADNGSNYDVLFQQNGIYNPDIGLYLKGVNKPGYSQINSGEFSRDPSHYGLSLNYRQDQLNYLNNRIPQNQPKNGFNFGYDTELDMPTSQVLKTNIYTNLPQSPNQKSTNSLNYKNKKSVVNYRRAIRNKY